MNIEGEKAKRQEFCAILKSLSVCSLASKSKEEQAAIYKRLEALYASKDFTSGYRHFYADIFSVFSQLEEDSIEIVCSNLDYVRQEYQPQNFDESGARIDINNNLKKLYDHASLEMARINYIKRSWSDIAQNKEITELGRKLNSQIPRVDRLVEEVGALSEKANNAQRDYIAILSIFAAVLMVFFSGIGFSSSVLANIHQASIYRVLLSITLLGMVLFNVICVLFKFLREIIGKKQSDARLSLAVNVTFILLFAIIFFFSKYDLLESL